MSRPTNWLDYDLDACKANLERCDKNIATFEEAIDKEREHKELLLRIIATLEAKQIDRPKRLNS